MLIEEIRALENEITRLKQTKIFVREFRKYAHMPGTFILYYQYVYA
jgi:hypothetical protein